MEDIVITEPKNGFPQFTEVRTKMTNFWNEHSHSATEEEMMLDTNADVLGKEEVPEILSVLPDYRGKDVLELGAGIGRFTKILATKAESIIAVDFMENFIRNNQENNGHLKNITFLRADVTDLDYPPKSFDLVFSNWLLMYLEENEVENLFKKIFDWLRPGGYLFFRESCFHQSGNRSRGSNPSLYRKPSMYNDILRHVRHNINNNFSLKLIMSRSVQTYIKMKSNRNQIFWLVQKVVANNVSDEMNVCRMFGEHFEDSLSSLDTITSIEKNMGDGCVTSGEKELFENISSHLQLESSAHVLSIGCGLGWAVFHMAQKDDIKVYGIDPSANMISVCLERANILKMENIELQMDDLSHLSLPPHKFDTVLYCTSANVEDHSELFTKIAVAMKESGRLVIMDYCFGTGKMEESSLPQHVKKCKYHMLDELCYKQVLSDVGFDVVYREELTKIKLDALKKYSQKLKGDDRLARMQKEMIEDKILWLDLEHLQLLCFVCQLRQRAGTTVLDE